MAVVPPPVATGIGPWRIVVHGELLNPKNASGWIWQKRRRWAQAWRDRTSTLVLASSRAGTLPSLGPPERPKRVRFLAFVARFYDDDNLRMALAPIRDGLQDAWVIHSDAWTSGHVFKYDQAPRPKAQRGVQITVEPL